MSPTGLVHLDEGPDAGALWHAGNPVAEQRALQAGRGVVDLGHHQVVRTGGADRLQLLHLLTTQYFENLAAGAAVSAMVLSAQGHIQHAFTGIDDGEAFWAVTEPGRGEPLAGHLESMKFMMRVEATSATDQWRVLAVGDQVDAGQALGWPSGIPNVRTVLWPRDAELPEADPVGVWALEALRIEAGLPRIFADTDERTIPNEIGLWGTHLDKGCYPGQETVAKVHTLGRPPRRLTRLHLDGSAEALPAAGAPISHGGRVVGVMGTSARHHLEGPIGLALVKRALSPEVELRVDPVETEGPVISAAQEVLVDPEIGLHVRPLLR